MIVGKKELQWVVFDFGLWYPRSNQGFVAWIVIMVTYMEPDRQFHGISSCWAHSGEEKPITHSHEAYIGVKLTKEVYPSISNIALKLWSTKVCIWHIHLAADWAEWIVARTQNMESGRCQKPPQGQWPPGDSAQIDELTMEWIKKTRPYERIHVH